MTVPSPRLLLVDDYPDALELLALLLEQSGYVVDTARTGADALKQADLSPPDLAILDVELPDMTGLEVARALRHREATRSLPILALTGRGTSRDVDEAREAGIDRVFVKPCEPSALLSAIQGMLGGRED
jgi:DNA-binding response OmpR family regulator